MDGRMEPAATGRRGGTTARGPHGAPVLATTLAGLLTATLAGLLAAPPLARATDDPPRRAPATVPARKPAPAPAVVVPEPERGADIVSTLPGASSHRAGEQLLSTANQRNAGRDRLVTELERQRELDALLARPEAQPPMAVVVDPRDRHRGRERPTVRHDAPGPGTTRHDGAGSRQDGASHGTPPDAGSAGAKR